MKAIVAAMMLAVCACSAMPQSGNSTGSGHVPDEAPVTMQQQNSGDACPQTQPQDQQGQQAAKAPDAQGQQGCQQVTMPGGKDPSYPGLIIQ